MNYTPPRKYTLDELRAADIADLEIDAESAVEVADLIESDPREAKWRAERGETAQTWRDYAAKQRAKASELRGGA